MRRQVENGLWPIDWLMLSYLAAIGFLIAGFGQRIDGAVALLLGHGAAMAAILAYALLPDLPGAFYFRNLYALPYVFGCYRVMSLVIRSIRESRFDATLTAWDFALWGAHPTVWLERVQFPLLTELLQVVYALFVPAVLAIAVILWIRQRENFRSYAFLLTLGFLASYVLYFIVPARGPRFFLDALQTQPLSGLWLFSGLRSTLDVLESPHFDCFPSGHVELTILAWWTARGIHRRLAAVYLVYTGLIVIATVYLRYHYTIDLLAGVFVAAVVLAARPYLEGAAAGRERQFHDEQTPDFARSK